MLHYIQSEFWAVEIVHSGGKYVLWLRFSYQNGYNIGKWLAISGKGITIVLFTLIQVIIWVSYIYL